MIVLADSAGVSVQIYVVGDAGHPTPGEPVTGLGPSDVAAVSFVHPAGSPDSGAAATITPDAQGDWVARGFIEISSSNHPGLYRVDVPDAAFASSDPLNNEVAVQVTFTGASNAVADPLAIDIISVDLRPLSGRVSSNAQAFQGNSQNVTKLNNLLTGTLTATVPTTPTPGNTVDVVFASAVGVNQLKDWSLSIIGGSGSGQAPKRITGNTASVESPPGTHTSTITVERNFSPNLDDDSVVTLVGEGRSVWANVADHGGSAALVALEGTNLTGARVSNLDSLDANVSSRATQVTADAIETDTQDIQGRLPPTLAAGNLMRSDAEAISASTAAADAVEANIGNLDAAVSGTSTHSAADVVAAMDATSADLDAIIAAIAALNDITVADILAGAIETGAVSVNLAEALRAMLATTAGTSPAPVSGRRTYESPNGAARVAMDVSAGNRSNPTYTLTP